MEKNDKFDGFQNSYDIMILLSGANKNLGLGMQKHNFSSSLIKN